MPASSKLDFQKQITQSWLVASTAAATADNYGIIYTAPYPVRVIGLTERHETAGSDGGAVTLQLEKVPSGTAKGSGTNLLATALSLKATANTVQNGSLVSSSAVDLAAGDSIALKTSGTLTAVDGVAVTVRMQRL
jgi:hypothetical protein